jgi:hypothetical protein
VSAIFAQFNSETVATIMREPVAAEMYLDCLALLEDQTHAAVPELDPPRFTGENQARRLDELTRLAQRSGYGEIADNIDINRGSWERVLSRVETGSNRQVDIAMYVHGARTYRDFVLEESELATVSARSDEQTEHRLETAATRSAVRLSSARFPAKFIADELGLPAGVSDSIIRTVERRIEQQGDRAARSAYGVGAEELVPFFDPSGPSVFSYRSSNGIMYFLHSKRVVLRGGKEQTIYFFAKDPRPADAVSRLPAGYVVNENPRNGFLTLKKS